METITYKFPNNYPEKELRGETYVGGLFGRMDGDSEGEYDAVCFGCQAIGNKMVALKVPVENIPELMLKLESYKAKKKAVNDRLTAIGWFDYSNAIALQSQNPSDDTDYKRKFPLAAAYAEAKGLSMVYDDKKAQIGKTAMNEIEKGLNPLRSIIEMRKKLSDSAEQKDNCCDQISKRPKASF